MIKLWIFLEFMAKKKLDLDEVYFWHKSHCICWKHKGNGINGFVKSQFIWQQIPAQVFRVKISKSQKYKH